MHSLGFLFPQHRYTLEIGSPLRLGQGRIRVRLLVEVAERVGLVHRQDLLDGLAAMVEGGDVLLHGVP